MTLAEAASHQDPSAPVVLALAFILFAAKLGGDLAVRLKQPAVLGELMVGVLIGNLPLLGIDLASSLKADIFVDMLARLGVIILLFEVGLESTVPQMLKVGRSAAVVALVGVAVPFGLGFLATRVVLPEANVYVALFVGATLTATSVGITARVLKDLGQSQTAESRVILGAAVIDDVLGLVILSVVSGLIIAADAGTTVSVGSVVLTVLKALGFLVGSLVIGLWLSPRLFHVASRLRARQVLLPVGLGFCFTLAYLSDLIGLAPIVGAFAAGLILEDVHYAELSTRERHDLRVLLEPLSSVLVPVFFVLMGMRTDLRAFAQPGVPVLAAVLCVVAVVGKVVAGVGAGAGVRKLVVGLGMIPRGEVGLIFASIGGGLTIAGQPVVDSTLFSAVVVMVIVTTMLTPPALTWSLARKTGRSGQS